MPFSITKPMAVVVADALTTPGAPDRCSFLMMLSVARWPSSMINTLPAGSAALSSAAVGQHLPSERRACGSLAGGLGLPLLLRFGGGETHRVLHLSRVHEIDVPRGVCCNRVFDWD